MNTAYFSPGEDCRDTIIDGIRSATSLLDICVFTIADDRITREILARHRNGLRIRIITDNDKCYDHGSDIEEMVKAGIDVKVDKSPEHMHHKFMIIDKCILHNGSYNWTRSAAECNHENWLVTDISTLVKPYCGEFEKLWKMLDEY
jgi:mitochondrial cardiolipin hydrolase